jgi:multidrug resistance efflux pump
LLVELDDSNARADLAKAIAQLRAAQANYAATQAGGSQEELLRREAALTKARVEYSAANRNVERCSVCKRRKRYPNRKLWRRNRLSGPRLTCS